MAHIPPRGIGMDQSTNSLLAAYEQVPYRSSPRPHSHPDAMATVATLLELEPAPIDRCRVLELGCASGVNIIPLADTYPHSRFLGIDLAPSQIAEGRAIIDALRLTNISLEAASISDLDCSIGEFDYIISHGVYSWVPAQVQQDMLRLCAARLAPHGVAYISYNTYPGWHVRGMIRQMIAYHAARFTEPARKIEQSRALIEWLAHSLEGASGSYSEILAEEAAMLRAAHDSYLYHEHLETENHPVYFHEFIACCAAAGLQYLGESHLCSSAMGQLPREMTRGLDLLAGDLLQREQYLDFLRNRTFRRTLLVREDAAVRRPPDPRLMPRFRCLGAARPTSEVADPLAEAPVEFAGPNGQAVSIDNPALKAALLLLYQRIPWPVPFDELLGAVRAALEARGKAPANLDESLPRALLQCHLAGIADLRISPPPFTVEIATRPRAFRYARAQAADGLTLVTNLLHQNVDLDDFQRLVLELLDGTLDMRGLLAALAQKVAAGQLTIEEDGRPATPQRLAVALDEGLRRALPRLARSALLVA